MPSAETCKFDVSEKKLYADHLTKPAAANTLVVKDVMGVSVVVCDADFHDL